MAGTTVGKLNALLTADTSQFTAQLKSASKEVETFSSITTKVAGVFGIGLGIGAVTSFLTSAAQEAANAAKSQAQLESALDATGNTAGLTAEQIDRLATSLQNKLAIDDDVIKSSAALLISFQDIRGEILKQALPAVANLSRFYGKDMPQATLILGKALADPIDGLTALGKAGIKLTDQQKKMIDTFLKVGDVAKAQQIILDAVASHTGNAAERMKQPIDELTVAWGNLKEEIGKSELISGGVKGLTENIKQFGKSVKSGPYGAYIEDQKKAAEEAKNLAEASQKATDESAFFGDVLEVQQTALDKVTESFQRQIDTVGMSADEIKIWDLQQTRIAPDILEVAKALAEQKAAVEEANKQWKEYQQTLENQIKTQNNIIQGAMDQNATVGMSSDQIEMWRLKQAGADKEMIDFVKNLQDSTRETKKWLETMTEIDTSRGASEWLDEALKKIDAINEAEDRGAISREAALTANKKLVELGEKALKSDMKKLFDETRTPAEKAQKEIDDLNTLLERGLDPDVYLRKLKQIEEGLSNMIEMKDELVASPGGAALEFGTIGAYSATRAQMIPPSDQRTHEKLDGIKSVLDRIRELLANTEPVVVEAGV